MISEYNTDDETDELLERQYNVSSVQRNNLGGQAATAEDSGADTLHPVQVACMFPNVDLVA